MIAPNAGSLDDEPQFDEVPAFAGGQVSYTRPHLLEPMQCAELKNIDIQQNGIAVTRRGTDSLGDAAIVSSKAVQGLAYFDTPSIERMVACIDSTLYTWDGATWSSLGTSYQAATDDTQVCLVQGQDRLWIADGISNVHYWDGSSLVDAGSGSSDQPPVCKYLVWHTNRLFAAGVASEPDAIYVSDFFDGLTWDQAEQQIEVGSGEGDPITAIASWLDNALVVFKRSSVWVVDANPVAQPGNWPIKLVHRLVGCVAHRTVCQVGGDLWFLSDTGVRSLQRDAGTSDQQTVTPALSYPVQDIIERISWSNVDKACAIFWASRYMLAIPVDGASYPNYVLVYNTLTQSWSGYWTGWKPTQFAISRFSGAARLNFGQSDGLVRQWLDYVAVNSASEVHTQDSGGVDIPAKIVTRALNFQAPVIPKTGYWSEVEFFQSAAAVDLAAIVDQVNTVEIAEDVTTGFSTVTLPVLLPFTLPRVGTIRKRYDLRRLGQFREIQLVLETSGGRLAVRGLVAGAFVDSLQTRDAA